MTIYDFIPKYIRQTIDRAPRETITNLNWNELWNLVISQGDWNSEIAYLLTQDAVAHKSNGDHDYRYYTKTLMDGIVSTLATKAENNLKANAADVYTKTEMNQYLQGGDTVIKREVFTIVTTDNGDGTFTYSDEDGVQHFGAITGAGGQTFALQKGAYLVGQERIEACVNDTLWRSVTSGGLEEPDTEHVVLTSAEGVGAEITFKYFEKVAIAGLGLIAISATQPGVESIWFKVVG